MKTKKHKKHKSERYDEERTDKEPLRLVLKVGDSLSTLSPHHESKKHKHKKKKKKKSKDKDHHRREEEKRSKHHHRDETEEEMEVSQEDDDEEHVPVKPIFEESDGTEHEEVHVPPPPRPRELREKTIIPTPSKGDDEHGVLRICLKYLQEKMKSKDVNGFFAYPVNDMIAPGYSIIISHPMDFSTMKAKIDNDEYKNVMEYKKDFVLMCNNAMHYNRPETIYYKEAKKLLHVGMKAMSREKLLIMKRTLPFMASLRYEELGLDEPDDTKAVMEAIVEEEKELKQRAKDREEIGRFEAVPDNMSAAEILSQAQAAAKDAADMLTLRQPNSRFGFLRKREDGSTTMKLLNPDNDGIVSKTERVITIGKLIGKLGSGGATLTGYKEDKRNRVTPGQYLNYGPFGTYAPQYDSTFANMTKDETDLVLSTYGDETGVQYAKSVMSFVENGGDYAISMVDSLLDILTKGEHAKTKQLLEQRMKDGGGDKTIVVNVATPEDSRKTPVSNTEEEPNIDFDSLRSLNDIGVDMSFLDNIEKSMKMEKDPVQEKLDQTATLINDLQQTQNERLSQNIPTHISQVPGPSEKEIQLAHKVNKELKELAQEATPGSITNVQGLRNAMGVSVLMSESSESDFISSQSTQQPTFQTNLPIESTQPQIVQSNQQLVSLQSPITVNQTMVGSYQTGEQTLSSGTVYSSNIPNIISQHNPISSYQTTGISAPSVIINQQTQLLQTTSIAYQPAQVPMSSSMPFQSNTINLMNQGVGINGQEMQNDINSGVTIINDDDSDAEMDISEFLQFPSS